MFIDLRMFLLCWPIKAGSFWEHIWYDFDIILGSFLVSRRLPTSEFERELPLYRSLAALGASRVCSWSHVAPPKLSQVCLFQFFTLPKNTNFQKGFRKAFDTLLGTSWDRFGIDFGKFFETQIDANKYLS